MCEINYSHYTNTFFKNVPQLHKPFGIVLDVFAQIIGKGCVKSIIDIIRVIFLKKCATITRADDLVFTYIQRFLFRNSANP